MFSWQCFPLFIEIPYASYCFFFTHKYILLIVFLLEGMSGYSYTETNFRWTKMFSNRKSEKNCQILASCKEKYYRFKYIKCADFEISVECCRQVRAGK